VISGPLTSAYILGRGEGRREGRREGERREERGKKRKHGCHLPLDSLVSVINPYLISDHRLVTGF